MKQNSEIRPGDSVAWSSGRGYEQKGLSWGYVESVNNDDGTLQVRSGAYGRLLTRQVSDIVRHEPGKARYLQVYQQARQAERRS